MYNDKFMQCARAMVNNGTMNMYVQEAIDNNVPVPDLVKEIKLAIKMHRKYDKQPGSSPMHIAVVVGLTTLLGLLDR